MNATNSNKGMHEDARECTVSAGGGGGTGSASGADGPDDPVHDDARFCTVSAAAAAAGAHDSAGKPEVEPESGLPERQRTAMGLLLLGRPYIAVARAVGVDPSTLYRWRQDESFRDELERRGQEMWDGAAERLRALVHPALDVLEEEVHDEYDRSRVRAAGMILRLANLRKSVRPGKEEGAV